MKKLICTTLSALLLLTALLGCLVLSPAAEEDLPTPTFSYDFSEGFDGYMHPSTHLQVSYENADGYVTFKAEGDDPYFQFTDEHQPTVTTENLAYAIIKYRTTAEVAKGESFTNRRSGPQWGADGTHVEWKYINDGEWHVSLIDTTAAWGSTEGDTLYAFRLDPLATGAKAGDTIDIEFIHFFADKQSALDYAITVSPDDEFYLMPRPEHTVKFLVDDRVIYTVTFKEGDTKLESIPVVPNRPGCDGVWEDFTLGNTDIEVKAIYTPKVVETAPETLPPMPVETDPPETVPPMPTETLPETQTDTAPADTSAADTNPESETVLDGTQAESTTETATGSATVEVEVGCQSVVALSALVLSLSAAALCLRRKDD